jgi:hypothetical protein
VKRLSKRNRQTVAKEEKVCEEKEEKVCEEKEEAVDRRRRQRQWLQRKLLPAEPLTGPTLKRNRQRNRPTFEEEPSRRKSTEEELQKRSCGRAAAEEPHHRQKTALATDWSPLQQSKKVHLS